MDAATSLFGWLKPVFKTTKRRPLVEKFGEVSRACAAAMVAMAQIPSAVCRSAKTGVETLLRIRCFMVRLLMALQLSGFDMLVANMLAFRVYCAGIVSNGGQCTTVLAMTHAWDESKQMLRDPPRAPGARQSTQRIARNILAQRSVAHAGAAVRFPDGRVAEYARSESIVVPPLELFGKTTAYLSEGIRRGLLFPLFDKHRVSELGAKLSAVVLTFLGDSASTNKRFLKHLVGTSREDQWPPSILLDVGQVCLLHQIHRIKVQLIDAQNVVSLLYCLSKLVRAGSVLHLVADYVGDFAQNTQRIVRAPPPGPPERTRQAMDILYAFESAHHRLHGKKGISKSRLLKDVEAVLRMDNGGLENRASGPIHYCDDGHGRPCCRSRAETIEKLTEAYLNLFVCHGIPVATLSRWTHITTVCTSLCTGFICRDVFVNALLHGLREDTQAEAIAQERLSTVAAGAGDDDRAVQHRARVTKVRTWLAKETSRVHITCLFVMLKVLESLTYFLMGGERIGEERHRRPGTVPRSEQALPLGEFTDKVRHSLSEYATLLSTYGEAGSVSASLFSAVGIDDSTSRGEPCMRIFRRLMVGASAGVCRRLGVRLRSFPLKLWMLVESGVSEEIRRQTAMDFLAEPECCLGIFGAGLKKLCPTLEDLLGDLGQTVVKTWLRSQHWSTYDCEKDHGSVRRLCSGTGPGRNWSLVARERVMEAARSIHTERTATEKTGRSSSSRAPKRDAQAILPAVGAAQGLPPSPLDDRPPRAPLEVKPWTSHLGDRKLAPLEDIGGGSGDGNEEIAAASPVLGDHLPLPGPQAGTLPRRGAAQHRTTSPPAPPRQQTPEMRVRGVMVIACTYILYLL